MPKATSVVDALLGEAGGTTPQERYADMVNIASAIVNRAALTGSTIQDVVSNPADFNAMGKSLPAGVGKYRSLAVKALNDVLSNGPVHTGTFFATPGTVKNLPSGLTKVGASVAHQFFDDPQNRSIRIGTKSKKIDPAQKQMAVAWAATNAESLASRLQNFAQDTIAAVTQAETQATNKRAPTGQSTTVSDLGATVPAGLTSPLGVMGDRITSNFGPRTAPKTANGYGSTNHMGTDLSLGPTAGYAAEAIAGGRVEHAGRLGKLGNAVTISHPDGTTSTYGHLASISVTKGDTIARGTPIGTVGQTGNVKGPHLHFSMTDKDGKQINPASMIAFNRDVRVPTPVARPTTTPQATPESMVSAFATTRNVNPAVAAIDAQMGKTPTVSQASLNDQRAAFSAAQQAAARQAQAQAVSAQQQQANQARAAQMAQYGVGQQAMRSALSAQQPSQVSAKTSRIGADARAALAAGLADQRAGLTSQTPIGIAGRTIGAMAGLATPTRASDTFSELAGKKVDAANAVARATPSIANALNKQTAELTGRQVSQPSVGPQSAMNALGGLASSIDPSAMARSFNSFTHTPIGSYAKNTALGNFAQGLALAADVATPEAASALAAGMAPQDVFGTATETALDPISISMTPQVTTSALASYAPSDVTGSVLSGALNDMERAGTDFAGGATGLSAVDRNAADNLPGRYGPRAGIALGGLLGSVLGGPIGGLLGAMAGGSLANRSGPAGGTGGLLGGMFGGSYSGDGNQGPGPGGRGALGGGSAGTSNSGGSRKNEQGSRR